jgi:hypothetical protein
MRLVDMFIREHVLLVWIIEGGRLTRAHGGACYWPGYRRSKGANFGGHDFSPQPKRGHSERVFWAWLAGCRLARISKRGFEPSSTHLGRPDI